VNLPPRGEPRCRRDPCRPAFCVLWCTADGGKGRLGSTLLPSGVGREGEEKSSREARRAGEIGWVSGGGPEPTSEAVLGLLGPAKRVQTLLRPATIFLAVLGVIGGPAYFPFSV
jgi:hypothetical protein